MGLPRLCIPSCASVCRAWGSGRRPRALASRPSMARQGDLWCARRQRCTEASDVTVRGTCSQQATHTPRPTCEQIRPVRARLLLGHEHKHVVHGMLPVVTCNLVGVHVRGPVIGGRATCVVLGRQHVVLHIWSQATGGTVLRCGLRGFDDLLLRTVRGCQPLWHGWFLRHGRVAHAPPPVGACAECIPMCVERRQLLWGDVS